MKPEDFRKMMEDELKEQESYECPQKEAEEIAVGRSAPMDLMDIARMLNGFTDAEGIVGATLHVAKKRKDGPVIRDAERAQESLKLIRERFLGPMADGLARHLLESGKVGDLLGALFRQYNHKEDEGEGDGDVQRTD